MIDRVTTAEKDGRRVFPRVLIVSKTRLTELDSTSASIGKWFSEWPRESLAHLYSGGYDLERSSGYREYHLTGRDRRFGRVYDVLKGSYMGEGTRAWKSGAAVTRGRSIAGAARGVMAAAGRRLISSGVWELIFTPRIAPDLREWLSAFSPDVVYIQAVDLSFMRLGLLLKKELGAPMCLHMMDDFPEMLYSGSPFSFVLRPAIRRSFQRLADTCGRHLAIGPGMAREYTRRYGAAFIPMMNSDDPERFRNAEPRRLSGPETVSILYSGGLQIGRWRGVADLSDAASSLSARTGRNMQLHVLAPYIPAEAEEALRSRENVTIHDAPADADVPGLFTGADILFLPESFEREHMLYTRYSVSTKSQLYMMSERPILVYGPSGIGTVQYAMEDGWALAVTRREPALLEAAVDRLLTDRELTERMAERGRQAVLANHDAGNVRRAMGDLLRGLAAGEEQVNG